jgi:hypothetical protein
VEDELLDLTAKFIEANERRESWDEKLFQSLCVDIAGGIESAVVDWDPGAGEEWGRIIFTKSVVAIVHVKLPLLFASNASPRPFHRFYLAWS